MEPIASPRECGVTVIAKRKTTPSRHSGAMRSIEPGIHNPRPWLWIPGLRPKAHPRCAIAHRGMTGVRVFLPSHIRHCERSEAIHLRCGCPMDCFAALAKMAMCRQALSAVIARSERDEAIHISELVATAPLAPGTGGLQRTPTVHRLNRGPTASKRRIPAVDHEAVRRMIGGCLAHQVHRNAAEVAGLSEPPHRNSRHHI